MADEERLLRVVRGVPTPEELAALVGAVFLRARPDTSARPAPVSTWAQRARPGTVSGMPARSGRDGWRVSGLPH
ncbi:acyl-CoA carboxylase subunit epsilon [Plantactinospora sp. S1510]|uniref:Acyl-CoA carboxylase subunit epsilon n=1 Tax=Plantactinospora alkalitolerans TaxID=2789879 RepID=A0ABS0GWJ7_9ACTN|nr:acyl-CoA carboxylase subunit epsilon [Plantactinospora alkalitolerans]MBF9130593.1 acyl-CoA carboxylase subunit epsilon [Plantactinospora alkalitolerans]